MPCSLQDMSHPLPEPEVRPNESVCLQVGVFSFNESEDHEEEDQTSIAWELEGRNKEGAATIR